MKMEQVRLRVMLVILVAVICYGVAYDLGFDPWIPTLVGGWITTIVVIVERSLIRVSIRGLIIGGLGLGVGIVLANLLAYPILLINPLKQLAPFILLLINVIFASVGLTVAVKREEEITNFLSSSSRKKGQIREAKYKILDTSVIIDGRIADLCETGFIEGILVIPNFILTELQQIADSSASTKRTRGRRGLDMVNRLQSQENIPVQIVERDFPDTPEVDSKLLQLAKMMSAEIITNDHNLKKVARIQNVKVLNINEVATALKPVLLPGESLRIRILKEGENPNQGIAYLEDGTMVVIEGGKKYIGKEADALVTSVLQTTTGKMIFTEIKNETGKERKRRVKGKTN